MIPDIGMMIGVYGIVRLLFLLYPAVPGQQAPAWQLVIGIIAIFVLGFLTADVVMQGTDNTNNLTNLKF